MGTISDHINFWINILSLFSTAFALFVAAVAITLGYLTWKHEKQKDKVEEVVEGLINTKKQMDEMFQDVKDYVNTIKSFVGEVEEKYKGIKSAEKKISKVKEKAEADEKVIKSKYQEFEKSLNNLATLSRFNPGDIVTEAKLDNLRAEGTSVLDDYQSTEKTPLRDLLMQEEKKKSDDLETLMRFLKEEKKE